MSGFNQNIDPMERQRGRGRARGRGSRMEPPPGQTDIRTAMTRVLMLNPRSGPSPASVVRDLFWRFKKFCNSLRYSPSQEVTFIFELRHNDVRSNVRRNIAYISRESIIFPWKCIQERYINEYIGFPKLTDCQTKIK